jgi:hypothetical protein
MMISLGRLRLALELDAHPAVTLVGAEIIPRRDGVGENEEGGLLAALLVEPLDQQLELVIEHVLQPRLADVALALAVDGVGKRHVVGGDRLGQRAGGAADPEEPAATSCPAPISAKVP